ncbi:MAG: hypothetical protein NTZ59_03315 [Bacteroidetes bacterium]|nr:hypothetical protein [Bacteroidota bacterium]
MKLIFTFFVLLSTSFINAQDLTGIWRGRFQQNNLDVLNSTYSTETYKYEVQINQLETNALEGVTYSYLSTVFYGKAALKGILNKKGKTLTIKETIMLDMRALGKTEPCLMTCYLDYSKSGKLEILSGTYTSVKSKDKSDCGSGTVYLEKVVESDFEKEDFLTKKKKEGPKTETRTKEIIKPNVKSTPLPKVKNDIATNKNNKKEQITKPVTQGNKPTPNKPKTTKPGAENFVIKKDKTLKDTTSAIVKNDKPVEVIKPEPIIKKIEDPVADVLVERENKLVNKIIVDDKNVTLEFYDNGEIDNDTISIYRDNKLIVDKKRLSTNPIVMNLRFDDINVFYEIITVAENLGDIPPNTALMVLTYGNNKRKEVFLTSDEKTNAKIIIEYKK